MKLTSPWFRAAALLSLVFTWTRPAAAGIDRFTPFGPMTGRFAALAADPHSPTTLLAAVDLNGVFRSDDGGGSWSWSGIGLGLEVPEALAADPVNAGVFYAISSTQAFRSDDSGRHWQGVGTGQDFNLPYVAAPAGDTFRARLAVVVPASPGVPATLLAAAGFFLSRSSDGGATWARVFTAPTSETGWSLAVDRDDPLRVWAGLYGPEGNGRALASTDAGRTWAPLASYPAPVQPGGVGGVAALIALPAPPGQPATLVVSSGGQGFNTPLFKSSDDGQTWRAIRFPILSGPVAALAYEPQTPAIVYAASTSGLFASSDGGETWLPRGGEIYLRLGIFELMTVPGTRTVYALANNDLGVSPDRARHWSIAAQSAIPALTPAFHSSPADPAKLYLVNGGAVWESGNGGASWSSFAATVAPPARLWIYDLAVDPVEPRILYLATQAGIYRTGDGGATWGQLSPAQFPHLQLVGRELALAGDCGVSRSRNGGRTWRITLACDPTIPGDFEGRTVEQLLLAPREPGVVYVRIVEVNGRHPARAFSQIWKSGDGGATWQWIVNDGEALALDPDRRGRIYISGQAGIARSDNGGRSFELLTSTFTAIDLQVDPATPSTLYAATAADGIWRSTDGGVTWEPFNAGLRRYVAPPWIAHGVALRPQEPSRVYGLVGSWIFAQDITVP